ncbi:DUF4199 domain-containing protein [Hymenobacter metallicola]|uniref:DUF4199 domain-containing protein n=1 Tax=Hymenobacter metallicola TaxID=2563114 RepID=A0A4Z0QEL0_9BACT|nr:DUF4199 domain-containing protein [Hymenobacter metallicola]TGE27886.1 DUF4199 domain-containing protein [Hymenobacter metallicola]
MENSAAPSATSIGLRYGLLVGLIICLASFIIRLLITDPNSPINNIIYVVLIVGIILAHRDYKAQNQGFLSFGQGLGLGLLTALVAGLVTGLFSYIYAEYIDPEYMSTIIEAMRTQMETQGRSAEQIETTVGWMTKMMSGPIVIGTVLLSMLFWGLIISLITSAFTKHNRPEFE